MNEDPSPSSSASEDQRPSRKYVLKTFALPDIDVHLVVPEDIAKYHGSPANPDLKSYASVAARIEEDLQWLCTKATGGESAAVNHLVNFGTLIAAFLEAGLSDRPELVTSVAKRQFNWPVMISSDSASLKNAASLRKRLQLGKEIRIRRDKVKFRLKEQLQRQVIYHCVVVFNALTKFKIDTGQKVEAKFPQMLEKLTAGYGDDEMVQIIDALHKGANANKRQQLSLVGNESKESRRALQALLKLPVATPYKAPPEVEALLVRANKLPELTVATQREWFALILEFLEAFTSGNLEENEVLRPLGEPQGDVEIHDLIERQADFHKMKPSFRDNERVNKAIRREIVRKLKIALNEFCKE